MAKKSGSKFVDKLWEDYTNYASSNKTFAKKTTNNINSQGRVVTQYRNGKGSTNNKPAVKSKPKLDPNWWTKNLKELGLAGRRYDPSVRKISSNSKGDIVYAGDTYDPFTPDGIPDSIGIKRNANYVNKILTDNNLRSKLSKDEIKTLIYDSYYADQPNGLRSRESVINAAKTMINTKGKSKGPREEKPKGPKEGMWKQINKGAKNLVTTAKTRLRNEIGDVASQQANSSNTGNQSQTAIKNVPAKSNKPTSHTIKQGETLGSIAKQYGVDWRTLASDNGISDPNMIIAGRKLNINGATKSVPKKKAAPARRKQSLERTKPIAYPSNGPTRADIASAYADRLQGVLDSLDAQVPTQASEYANQPLYMRLGY